MVNESNLFYEMKNNYIQHINEENSFCFKLANKKIKIKFNSQKLVYWFTISLEYLKTQEFDDDQADLIIYVWENIFNDSMPAIFSKYASEMIWRGGFLYFKNNIVKCSYSHEPAYYQYYNKEKNIAFCCVNDEKELPFLHVCHPFRQILHWWAQEHNFILTHSAGIGINKNGALLIAVGGSGKSTTAITGLLNGIGYTSDDYVLLEPDKNIAHFIYSAGYLNQDMIKRLPELKQHIIGYDKTRNNKTLVNLLPYKNRFIRELKYNMLLFPVLKKENKKSEIFKSEIKLKALTALAVSTTIQNEGYLNHQYMNKLINSVKNLPIYQFNIISDFKENSAVLKNFLLNKE